MTNSPAAISGQHDLSATIRVDGRWEKDALRSTLYLDKIDQELQRLGKNCVALDVGCGKGLARNSEPITKIAQNVGQLWGVEPDQTVTLAPCYSRTWRCTLEEADIPPSSVDLAFSYFVVEHVVDELAFCRALHRLLKPGGVFIAATVNGNCLFARAASILRTLHLDEWMLRLSLGHAKTNDFHYPTTYRLNTRRDYHRVLSKQQQAAQLWSQVELDYLENSEWYYYFPWGLRWCGPLYSRVVNGWPQGYSYLFVKMQTSI